MSKHDETCRDIARSEDIVLTPQGEPLFARDLPRWREIQDEVRAADARAYDAEIAWEDRFG